MRIIILIINIILVSCNYNRFDQPQPDAPIMPRINARIAELHYLAGTGTITTDITVKGTITSSDSAGNIYKQLYIQDSSGAAVLQIGLFDLYKNYPQGSEVVVQLKDMACAYINNTMSIGYQSAFVTYPIGIETINAPVLVSKHLYKTNTFVPVIARKTTIKQLTPENAGEVVIIEGYFSDGGTNSFEGEQRFEDYNGGKLTVYTSSYASFAQEMLPWGNIQIRGFVSYYGDKLQLVISSTDDLTLTSL